MTYTAKETSRFAGAPVELFTFTMGATVYRLTSSDVEPTVSSHLYTRTPMWRTEQDFSKEDEQATIDITLPATHDVAQLFAAWNPPHSVRVTVTRKHRTDAELITVFDGDVVAIKFQDAEAILTCAPAGGAMSRQIPTLNYQTQCNWAFCGDGCTKDPATVEFSATVTAVSGATVTSTTFGGHPANYFRGGQLALASGDRRTIVAHAGNVVTLIAPFTTLNVADVVTARAGCDHTEDGCAAHDNLVNHLGFPRIPVRNPFTQGIA